MPDRSKQDIHLWLSTLIDTHADEVHRHIVRLTGFGPHTEDLLQDTLLVCVNKKSEFEAVDNQRAWMFKVATFTCQNFIRKRQKMQQREIGVDYLEDFGRRITGNQDIQAAHVMTVLKQMDDADREILVLHDVEGFTHQEIADMTDSKVGTLKSRLSRARRKFRQRFVEQYPDTPIKELFG